MFSLYFKNVLRIKDFLNMDIEHYINMRIVVLKEHQFILQIQYPKYIFLTCNSEFNFLLPYTVYILLTPLSLIIVSRFGHCGCNTTLTYFSFCGGESQQL